MKKFALSLLAFALTILGSSQIRMTMVDPANHEIQVTNFGMMAVNISTYRLCALFDYQTLNQAPVTIVSGDFNLSPNESVTISWDNQGGGGFLTTASDLGLYLPVGSFGSAANMVDFMQYGAGGQGRENVAVAGGRWTAGDFLVTSTGPWMYTGNGTQNGMMFWSALVVDLEGCTDPTACNFNGEANVEDGSCVYGSCTNPEACNYDEFAICSDDNVCDLNSGCTEPSAINYDENATCDNGSCEFEISGCLDEAACNFNPDATQDDGNCTYPGCPIPFACNYDPDALCSNELICLGEPGSPCEDGDPLTTNETYDDNCNCVPASSNTIFDIVAGSNVHNTLESALIASGLSVDLSEAGSYTLFAPTDEAFNALPAGTVEALLMDPSGALTQILLYHTVGAEALSGILEDGLSFTTLQGQDVLVTINADGIFINNAQVIIADIIADNGVVHVINAVLIPEVPVSNTIYDIVAASAVHNTLQAALEASGLNEVLAAPGDYTLFAPTDDAFAALPAGTLEALLADPNGALTDILLYHVLGASVLSTELADGILVTTLQGQEVLVTINANGVFINDAQVIVADIIADNGVVHVIDAVLIPEVPVSNTIYDIVAASAVHNTLQVALEASGLNEVLAAPGDYTLFAPTDDAFAALPAGTLEALLADPNGALTDILLYHVLGASVLSTELADGILVTTLQGQDVLVTINTNGVFINDAQVIISDIIADNGVVHVIDAVLIPEPPTQYTIFDIIANSPEHTTLESAILAAQLENLLQSPGTYTAFAPTDAAFEALQPGLLDALLNDPNVALTAFLAYHAIDSVIPFNGLNDGASLTTMVGEDITITVNAIGTFVNDALITIADINASNGVVHVIDAVLLPTLNETVSIFDIVDASTNHTTLQIALEAAGLDVVLSEPGNYTLFAPTNSAFDALPAGTIDALLADTTGALNNILLYHTVGTTALSTDLSNGMTITTLQGQHIIININDQGVFVNNAQVILADLIANNGVVHVIDAVLLPAADLVPGCTDITACNFNIAAEVDDNSCFYPGCTNPEACNYDALAQCSDESLCDLSSGCTNPEACNFDVAATCDNGLCLFPSINEISLTIDESGFVTYNDTILGPGVFIFTFNGSNGCDSIVNVIVIDPSTSGCLDPTACNYDPTAGISDSASCVLPACKDILACNYDSISTCDGGICYYTSCNDPAACNFEADAFCGSPGVCEYANEVYNCSGLCNSDLDSDGVCDQLEVIGCSDPLACNYIPASTESGACSYPLEDYVDCFGNCLNDNNNNGICDEIELEGCTDPSACNYNPAANIENLSCLYPGCTDPSACNYDENATCSDNSCETPGCTNSEACNFNPQAICDDGQCNFPGCTDITACNYDFTAGCDDNSCVYPGCMNPEACNYLASAACDDNSCVFAGCTEPNACNFNPNAGCEDGSCDFPGCNDETACNFNPNVVCGDNSCVYVSEQSILDCNGNCINDTNNDGICDEFEGTYCADSTACNFSLTGLDTICFYPGCTDPLSCNYNGSASCDDGSCSYPGCTEIAACNYDASAVCEDGSCEFPACTAPEACNFDFYAICDDGSCQFPACTDPTACNYDPTATCDGGVCLTSGCTDNNACNYDTLAVCDDNSCILPSVIFDCEGNCNFDTDNDGVCDQLEIAGCQDSSACNYNPASTDEGTCEYPDNFTDCSGNCINDINNNNICDETEATGCTDISACNYDASATFDDGNCIYPAADYLDCNGACLFDADNDGVCDPLDSLGCTNSEACNYNSFAITDDASCTFPGCVDSAACNFDANAGCDNGTCAYPGFIYDCQGLCFNDSDGDGVCNEFEIVGCTDTLACNFDVNATDAGVCEFPASYRNCDGICLTDTDADGVCDEEEVAGCYDMNACNYEPLASDSGVCEYALANYDCSGICLQDADADGICDQFEEAGCIDSLACNYNSFVDSSDNSCSYPGCLIINACNYDALAGCNVDSLCSFPEMYYDCDNVCLADADQDGICDAYDTTGCIIAGACNYNPLALNSDGSCVFPGCTILGACNYDPTAPCNVDSLCIIPEVGYDCTGSCIADADNDGVCNEFEIVGCTDTLACNYNEFVIDDDGSCSFNSEVTVNITVDQSEYPNGYVWQGEVFTSSGTYLYVIPNDAGCDSLITLDLTITVGIGEIIESQWNLWPNPARDYINVSGNSAIEYITILDVTGKVMLTQKYYGTINVSDFSSGMYIMQIKSSNGIEIKRFEISH